MPEEKVAAPVVRRDEDGFCATTLDEIYSLGRSALSEGTRAFLEEGAGGEQTLTDNQRSFSRWSIRPRYLAGVVEPNLAANILGLLMAAPILMAPIGGDGLFHIDGGRAVVRAAADCGLVPIVAEASTHSLEDYARVSSTSKIMQVHAWGTLAQFQHIVRRIEDSGYSAICVTIDCPTLGWRERTRRHRFDVQPNIWAGNATADMTRDDPHHLLTSGRGSEWTWATLAKARASTALPVLVKGVLTGDDARRAVAAGADGVIVSNHGGRQLDGVPATLDQLPEVVASVGSNTTVLLDGGIRRGLDVLKALASGAQAVMIGRPVALGLAAGGQEGVDAVLRLMIEELRRSMLLAGIGDLSGLDPAILQSRTIP